MRNDGITREIQFLQAKLDLLCAEIPDEPTKANARLLFGTPLEGWLKGNISLPPRRALLQHERNMEQFLLPASSKEARRQIERNLTREFGFNSLEKPISREIERILREGVLRSDDDAALVNGILSNLENEQVVGAIRFRRLAKLMGDFESR